MEWQKISKEILDKTPEIIKLKKGELQVKYAKALVKIDKAIEYLKETTFDFGTDEMIFDKCNAYKLLSILQGEEVK